MMYSGHILHLTQMASLCYWSKGSSCTVHFHIYKTTQNWQKHLVKQPKIDINAWNAVLAGSSDFGSCLTVKWDFSVQQIKLFPNLEINHKTWALEFALISVLKGTCIH